MTMLTALAMALVQAGQVVPVVPAPGAALPAPPDDWESMPELKLLRRMTDDGALSSYVRDEIRAGRCTAAINALHVDLAVLVAANGQVRRIRPRAIGCPTVEQYASGIMLRMARSNVAPPGEDRWYRTTVSFTWQ